MTDPTAPTPTPDLSLVDTGALVDEIGRRFGNAVLITTRTMNEKTGEGCLGTWVSEGTIHSQVIGLIEMARHWALRDTHGTFGGGMP